VPEDAHAQHVSIESIRHLYPLLLEHMQRAGPADQWFVLECLDTRVRVGVSGVTVSLMIPEGKWSSVSSAP